MNPKTQNPQKTKIQFLIYEYLVTIVSITYFSIDNLWTYGPEDVSEDTSGGSVRQWERDLNVKDIIITLIYKSVQVTWKYEG